MKRIGYAQGMSVRNNITSFLEDLSKEHPERVILSWAKPESLKQWNGSIDAVIEHDQMTVSALWKYLRTTAAGFEARGIKKGDRVLVFLPMSPPLYISLFALNHIGAIPVFLDGWARRDELSASVEIADAQSIISFPQAFEFMKHSPQLERIRMRCVYGGDVDGAFRLEECMQFSHERDAEAVEQEHTALITFTTGSSGRPKGADRTHRFLAAQHYALNRHLTYNFHDVDLPVFPIFSLNNIASGVGTVLPAIRLDAPSPNDPLLILAQLKSTGVTCATLSPWLFSAIAKTCVEKGYRLDTMRRIVTGGAPVSRDDLIRMSEAAPGAEICVLYGSTEVEPIAHISAQSLLSKSSQESSDPEWVDFGVNVGRIDEGLESRFIHIEDIPSQIHDEKKWQEISVETGQPGELIVMGEHVCRGYFRDDEAFLRAKIVDEKGRVWHRTGDVGYVDADNDLWLMGRIHNVIRHSTGYLFPVRVEMILRKLPFVKQAAFLGLSADNGYDNAVCAVECVSDGQCDYASAIEEIKRILNKNTVVFDGLVFVDAIPMDPRHHSKVQYPELREKIISSGMKIHYVDKAHGGIE